MSFVPMLLLASIIGYAFALAGGWIMWALLRLHPAAAAAGFACLCLLGTGYCFLFMLSGIMSTDSLRGLRFFGAFISWCGLLGASVWVLWFHGDPATVASWRPPLLVLAAAAVIEGGRRVYHRLRWVSTSVSSRNRRVILRLEAIAAAAALVALAAGAAALALRGVRPLR